MYYATNALRSLKVGLLTFIVFWSSVVFAATINVSTKKELAEAVTSASIPTEIIVALGDYSGESITLEGNTAPVTIRPVKDFEVYIQSEVKINGDFITITKFKLNEITVHGNDVKILRNIWDDAIPSTATYDWLNIETDAYRTEVGYNTFKNSHHIVQNRTNIISQNVNDDTSIPYETHIHHNYFKNIPSTPLYNEVYLIYSGGVNPPQTIDNNIIIEYNLFEETYMDGRIVDNKTNGTIIRNNTVINLVGSASFKNRSGSRCTFENNVLLGGQSVIATQGSDNIIKGNYIEYNQDSTVTSAFHFMYGTDDLSDKAKYNQMFNTVIEDNTLVDAYYGFEFGRNSSTSHLPMVDTIIRNNKIINGGARSTTSGDVDFAGNTIWENNKYSGNCGKFAEKMTKDETLVAVRPPYLTESDVGPYATTTFTTKSDETEIGTGAFIISPNGILK